MKDLYPACPIEGEQLAELIPHRGKMLLLSRVLDYNLEARTLRSEYDLVPECLFYDPALEGLPGWAGFECMAQAVSALSGLLTWHREALMGFILSVSSMEITLPLIPAGAVLSIEVSEVMQMDSVYTYDCAAFTGGLAAARAKLTVMEVKDPQMFMEKEQQENGNG